MGNKSQTAQPTGTLYHGLVGLLLCTLVPVTKVADKTSNHQVLVWKPSVQLHSSNVTDVVHATTLPPPSPSGCLLSKKLANSVHQLRSSQERRRTIFSREKTVESALFVCVNAPL